MPSYLLIVRAHLRFPLDARHPPRATSPLFSLRHYLATSLLQVAPVSPKPFRMNTCKNAPKPASLTTFRINTCKSVSKQRTLTTFRMNTYEKHRGGGSVMVNQTFCEGCLSRLPRASRGATIGSEGFLSPRPSASGQVPWRRYKTFNKEEAGRIGSR